MNLEGWMLWSIWGGLFLLGGYLGQFLNVCIDRFPPRLHFRDQLRSLKPEPRWWESHPKANRVLDSLPVLRWWFISRREYASPIHIPWRYPLLELMNGMLFVLVYYFEVPLHTDSPLTESCLFSKWGAEANPDALLLSPMMFLHLRYCWHLFLIESLVVATVIDLNFMIIPDGSTVPAMFVGILGGGLFGQFWLMPIWFQERSIRLVLEPNLPSWTHGLFLKETVPAWIANWTHLHGLLVSLAGFLIGGGSVWLIRLISRWTLKQEAMGFGDVTLMAAVGCFLGWQPALIVFFVAPALAMVAAIFMMPVSQSREIPYGPYLSLATLIVLLNWKNFSRLAEGFFAWGPLVIVMGVLVLSLLGTLLLIIRGYRNVIGVPMMIPFGGEYWMQEVWRPSDQLQYLSWENSDEASTGEWPSEEWEGIGAGEGTRFLDEWKSGGDWE